MEENSCNNLFVYGTLVDLNLFKELFKEEPFDARDARVYAKLYDCGKFPMMLEDVSEQVHGIVYFFDDLEPLLPSMDRYECCYEKKKHDALYVRKLLDVILNDGRTVKAWAYVGNVHSTFCKNNCVDKNFIPGGRWDF
jgi:gamma-glutamylcyclotransferase (GGCT)/AIG2-like uncharacterized protein YtfP